MATTGREGGTRSSSGGVEKGKDTNNHTQTFADDLKDAAGEGGGHYRTTTQLPQHPHRNPHNFPQELSVATYFRSVAPTSMVFTHYLIYVMFLVCWFVFTEMNDTKLSLLQFQHEKKHRGLAYMGKIDVSGIQHYTQRQQASGGASILTNWRVLLFFYFFFLGGGARV